MQDNIFSPSFGNKPSRLVGRGGVVDDLMKGLETRPGSRERSTVMLGQRGSGKTVLLWEIAERAQLMGYAVASPTIVSEGMLERVVEKAEDAAGQEKRHLTGESIGALGFSAGLQFSESEPNRKSPQHKLVQLARDLNGSGKGLIILVDELQANSQDLKRLAITYQEMVGEGLDVALLMAGLPGAVSATLNDKVLTFLNRSTKIELGSLPTADIDAFFAQSFKSLGVNISPDLRRAASEAASGSPYLMQLIGHCITIYAEDGSPVDEETFEAAIEAARADFENDVCKTSLSALSDQDVSFLRAVAELGSPASIGEVARSMNKTPDYAQKYRMRLIDSGMIVSPTRGKVAIDVPYLESYLKRQATQ